MQRNERSRVLPGTTGAEKVLLGRKWPTGQQQLYGN